MLRLATLLLLVDIALIVVALVDCLSADEAAIRTASRTAWIFIIMIFAPVGPLAWFAAGQPAPAVRRADGAVLRPAGRGTRPSRSPKPLRPLGPEDDPEFIASLADALRQTD
jgi:hypothetical protein